MEIILLSTVTGSSKMTNVSQYWDYDNYDNFDELVIRYTSGYFDSDYIYATISYFIISYSPIQLISFYDNSGN